MVGFFSVPYGDKVNARLIAVYFIDVLFWKNIALCSSNKKMTGSVHTIFFFLNTNTVKGVSKCLTTYMHTYIHNYIHTLSDK